MYTGGGNIAVKGAGSAGGPQRPMDHRGAVQHEVVREGGNAEIRR